MEAPDLTVTVILLGAISLASERLIEILKGIFPTLGTEKPTSRAEGKRQALILGLTIVAGILISGAAIRYANELVPDKIVAEPLLGSLILGILTAGGSNFWNSILGYTNNLKKAKEAEVQESRARVQAFEVRATAVESARAGGQAPETVTT